ncbi:MAG: bifunctional metallophosphatase/5'-nucleotidase [Chthonomonadales bacterium]
MSPLVILHTNDFHNRLTPQKAQRIVERRKSLQAHLLLDAGDAVAAGNLTFHPGGEPILDLMSGAAYDAMVVGNREFHFTAAGFHAKLSRARFPVLCANVHPRAPSANLPVVPWAQWSVEGKTVVAFGLTVPMITERMKVRHASAYVFADPIATARQLVPSLRQRCDYLICISHLGLRIDRELASSVPGINLIVGGHTHALLEHGELIDSTLIVQAGSHARFLGIVTVQWNESSPASHAVVETL